jgi:L-alanine-DL-glutamate epimerase-like enolase superfamily enzyme
MPVFGGSGFERADTASRQASAATKQTRFHGTPMTNQPSNANLSASARAPRIKRVRTVVVTAQPKSVQWNPRVRWNAKNIVLVILESQEGLLGIGEAFCDGGSPASVVALIENDLGPALIAADAAYPGSLYRTFLERLVVSAKGGAGYAAMSGVDIALWDLWGKHLGQPVSRLLGGSNDRVLAYASAGLYGPGKQAADLGQEMAGYVAQGFRAVKLKVGGVTLKEDLARVAAARHAIGPDICLMVDALYSWTPDQAIRMARALEDYDVHFLEAPVHPADIDGLRRVSLAGATPVAGNEYAYGLDGFRAIIETGAVSVVHLDAVLCGGITEAHRIAALAAAHHRPCSYHAASSAVCFASNLQAAAASPNCESIEYHMYHQMLFEHLAPDWFALQDGYVRVPDAPGIGLPFDPAILL